MFRREASARLPRAVLCASALIALSIPALSWPSPAAASTDLERALEGWRAHEGAGWSAWTTPAEPRLLLLYGRGRAPALERALDETQLVRLARACVERSRTLHGVEPATLVPAGVELLPLGQAGSTDKWSVTLRQRLDGLPVEDGSLKLLFDTAGRLLALESRALRECTRLPEGALVLDASQARTAAERLFAADAGRVGHVAEEPSLLVLREPSEAGELARACWRVALEADDARGLDSWTYFVDARSGELARREERALSFDVSGSVSSLISPRAWPDVPEVAEIAAPLANLEVTSGSLSVHTRADGTFTLPGLFASPQQPLTVSFRYRGPYATVDASGQPEYSLTLPLTAGTQNHVLMNRDGDEGVTAQANAFYWINATREWIRAAAPTNHTFEFQVLAKVNLTSGSDCSANFNGSQVRFHARDLACAPLPASPAFEFSCSGGPGGPPLSCPNKANASVIVHELGHWLNGAYSFVAGLTEFNEGCADAWAYYVTDQPLLAPLPCNNRKCWRNGETLLQFCGDTNQDCYGEQHEGGKVLGGALWKVRLELRALLGDALGRLAADSLFVAWMVAFDDSTIHSVIQLHWLLLDDTDGDLSNGTPNYVAIRGGFATQGFPPPP